MPTKTQPAIKVNWSGRGHHYSQEEIDVVVKAMKEAEPLTQGKYRDAFEEKFAEYLGVDHTFTVCNATAGIEMIAQLMQFQEGDEVICPAHTFTASVYPMIKHGATPVWADIDLETRVVTAATIAKCITPQTKAIIVVHLYGYVADMSAIMDLAKQHGILVVEDAAQSVGASVNGKQSGSFGDFGVFSFHSHKNMSTLGEGGMLVVKDAEIAAQIPMLRHNGHCAFDFERADYWLPAMSDLGFPKFNNNEVWPNNYCLGEVECALGIKLLDRIDQMNKERRSRAIQFMDALKEFPQIVFQRENSERHNYHQLIAYFPGGERDDFMRKMYWDKGVKCILPYYPLNRYAFYQNLGFGNAEIPITDQFFDNMTSLPFQHWMSAEEFDYMLKATKEILISNFNA